MVIGVSFALAFIIVLLIIVICVCIKCCPKKSDEVRLRRIREVHTTEISHEEYALLLPEDKAGRPSNSSMSV